MRAIFQHELRSYFTTPMGYVFLTMYTLLAGVVSVFANIGQEMSASANLFLSGMQLPFMLIAPILMMRFAQVSAVQVATTYLGYFLLDAAMLSAGILVSSLCVNQVTAAVVTLGR